MGDDPFGTARLIGAACGAVAAAITALLIVDMAASGEFPLWCVAVAVVQVVGVVVVLSRPARVRCSPVRAQVPVLLAMGPYTALSLAFRPVDGWQRLLLAGVVVAVICAVVVLVAAMKLRDVPPEKAPSI